MKSAAAALAIVALVALNAYADPAASSQSAAPLQARPLEQEADSQVQRGQYAQAEPLYDYHGATTGAVRAAPASVAFSPMCVAIYRKT